MRCSLWLSLKRLDSKMGGRCASIRSGGGGDGLVSVRSDWTHGELEPQPLLNKWAQRVRKDQSTHKRLN